MTIEVTDADRALQRKIAMTLLGGVAGLLADQVQEVQSLIASHRIASAAAERERIVKFIQERESLYRAESSWVAAFTAQEIHKFLTELDQKDDTDAKGN